MPTRKTATEEGDPITDPVTEPVVAEPLAPQSLVNVVTQLLNELGVLSGDVLRRVQIIMEREHLPVDQQEAVRGEVERILGAQARIKMVNAATLGLIELARTGKSVVSHSDADLS
jgi:hypothetical protein